jgi:S1-C subfamily serine protease
MRRPGGPSKRAHRPRRTAALALVLAALALPLDGCCTNCGALSRVGAATYTGPASTRPSSTTARRAPSAKPPVPTRGTAPAAVPAGAEAVGSAFYVNPKGQLLTAWAEVQGCRKVAILVDYEFRDVAVVAGSPLSALAVLDSRSPSATYGFFRTAPVAEGETVSAFAHPILDGISMPLESASGVVRSTASPDGVYGIVQSSAVLDYASVGGPLVDDHGNVIGIVAPKLSAGWPDDVAYGVSNSLILQFGAGVGVEIWERAAGGVGDAGAAPQAADYTVPVICFR